MNSTRNEHLLKWKQFASEHNLNLDSLRDKKDGMIFLELPGITVGRIHSDGLIESRSFTKDGDLIIATEKDEAGLIARINDLQHEDGFRLWSDISANFDDPPLRRVITLAHPRAEEIELHILLSRSGSVGFQRRQNGTTSTSFWPTASGEVLNWRYCRQKGRSGGWRSLGYSILSKIERETENMSGHEMISLHETVFRFCKTVYDMRVEGVVDLSQFSTRVSA